MMTQAEIFELFVKYDVKHAQAVGKQDIFERCDAIDDVLTELLSELAKLAKPKGVIR